jgi:hypothetical protein
MARIALLTLKPATVHLRRSQRLAILLGAIMLSVIAICPPCRKNDVVLDPVTLRVGKISPWSGYLPLFALPHPPGSRGGSFFVAWELVAIHFSMIIFLTALTVWSSGLHLVAVHNFGRNGCFIVGADSRSRDAFRKWQR